MGSCAKGGLPAFTRRPILPPHHPGPASSHPLPASAQQTAPRAQLTFVLHSTLGASWGYPLGMVKSKRNFPPLHTGTRRVRGGLTCGQHVLKLGEGAAPIRGMVWCPFLPTLPPPPVCVHPLVDALVRPDGDLKVLRLLLALWEVDGDVLGEGQLHQVCGRVGCVWGAGAGDQGVQVGERARRATNRSRRPAAAAGAAGVGVPGCPAHPPFWMRSSAADSLVPFCCPSCPSAGFFPLSFTACVRVWVGVVGAPGGWMAKRTQGGAVGCAHAFHACGGGAQGHAHRP